MATFGAAKTNLFSDNSMNALGALAGSKEGGQQAAELASLMYPEVPEADPWMAAFKFFQKMGEISSQPGSTTLSSLVQSPGAAMDYLQETKAAGVKQGQDRLKAGISAATSLKPKDDGVVKDTVYKTFRDNYNKSPDMKKYEELKGHMDNVSSAYELAYTLERPQVADLSMIFAYMKMLDPTSVVRESEQDQARRTGGAADWLINYVSMLQGGGSLKDEQRRSFRDGAFRLYQNKTESLNNLNIRFETEAETRGLKDRFDLYKITPKVYDIKIFGEYPGDDKIDSLSGSDGLTELSIIVQYENINQAQIAKINQQITKIKEELGL